MSCNIKRALSSKIKFGCLCMCVFFFLFLVYLMFTKERLINEFVFHDENLTKC